MRIVLLLAFLLPGPVIAQGAVDEIQITTQVAFPTPVGAATSKTVLIQDQIGFLSRRVLAAVNSEGVSALSALGDQTFYVPQISFEYQDLNFLSGDIVNATGPNLARADGLNVERPFSRSDGVAAMSVEPNGLFIVPARTVRILQFVGSPRTVIRSQNGSITPYFDGAAAGIPKNVSITALEILSGGELLLSFDTSFVWAGLTVRPGDIIWHDGSGDSSPKQFLPRAQVLGPCQSCVITGMSAEVNSDVIFRTSFFDTWGEEQP